MLYDWIKGFLRDYFTLNTRERNGALTMALIIFMQCGVLLWLNYFSSPERETIQRHQVQLMAFADSVSSIEADSIQLSGPGTFNDPKKYNPLFVFDPNTATDSMWLQLGLTKKQTAVIRNYLDKGGRYYKNQDLQKMYCISNEMYNRLQPYISIAVPEGKRIIEKTKPVTQQVEINGADTNLLATLPMIGPGRARMIFKYRETLGGFVQTRQLLEVYTIDTSVYNTIEKFISLDNTAIRKFNINSDTIQHPYLSKQIARSIIAFRKQHGPFRSPNDLLKLELVNSELIDKLAPYMAFE